MQLLVFTILLYLFASVAICASSFSWFIKLVLFGLLVQNGRNYLKRHIFLRANRSVIAFWKQSPAYWSLQMQGGQVVNGNLKKNSLITHFLMVLNYQCEQSLVLTIILTPESIGHQQYRKLLVLLFHFPATDLRKNIS